VTVLDDISTGTPANLASIEGQVSIVAGDVKHPSVAEAVVRDAEVIFHLAVVCLREASGDPMRPHVGNDLGTTRSAPFMSTMSRPRSSMPSALTRAAHSMSRVSRASSAARDRALRRIAKRGGGPLCPGASGPRRRRVARRGRIGGSAGPPWRMASRGRSTRSASAGRRRCKCRQRRSTRYRFSHVPGTRDVHPRLPQPQPIDRVKSLL